MTQPASTPTTVTPDSTFPIEEIRKEFPILGRTIHNQPLVYLDSAASAQKPEQVISVEADFLRSSYANVHRGVHTLSQEATAAYESARASVASFLGASHNDEIVFLRGTTEAINLVSQAFARPQLQAGDEILLTGLEHHSNIVPWQLVAEATGAAIRVARLDGNGDVDLDHFADQRSERTRICSFAHVSNALGTVNPVSEMIALAQECGAVTVVDGAQAAPHLPLDVTALGCDFYAFSGHKNYGPGGIGALYGRQELLASMAPYQGGGEMIRTVSFEATEYADIPHRFEAGTPNIAGAVGFETALRYLQGKDLGAVGRYEDGIIAYALDRLQQIENLRLIGLPRRRVAVISFVLEGIHAHDVGTILDREGVAVRAGHHCAQPVMDHFGVPATVRASFGLYNSTADVDRLADALQLARRMFG